MNYATRTELREEIRTLQSTLRELAADLGSDITYLNSKIEELQQELNLVTLELTSIKAREDTNEQ